MAHRGKMGQLLLNLITRKSIDKFGLFTEDNFTSSDVVVDFSNPIFYIKNT